MNPHDSDLEHLFNKEINRLNGEWLNMPSPYDFETEINQVKKKNIGWTWCDVKWTSDRSPFFLRTRQSKFKSVFSFSHLGGKDLIPDPLYLLHVNSTSWCLVGPPPRSWCEGLNDGSYKKKSNFLRPTKLVLSRTFETMTRFVCFLKP